MHLYVYILKQWDNIIWNLYICFFKWNAREYIWNSDARKTQTHKGGGVRPHLPTGGECSNFTDYSILNKYMHTLHVDWCYHLHDCIASGGCAPNFFHIIVCKIVKLSSWSKFTNWITTSLLFFQLVGQNVLTGSKYWRAKREPLPRHSGHSWFEMKFDQVDNKNYY